MLDSWFIRIVCAHTKALKRDLFHFFFLSRSLSPPFYLCVSSNTKKRTTFFSRLFAFITQTHTTVWVEYIKLDSKYTLHGIYLYLLFDSLQEYCLMWIPEKKCPYINTPLFFCFVSIVYTKLMAVVECYFFFFSFDLFA